VTTQERGSRAASLSSDEGRCAELMCTCGMQIVENKTSTFNCQNHQLERAHLPSMMAENPVTNQHKVSSLLSPESRIVFVTEEQLHPWSTDRSQTFDTPLLRTWDHCSGSQPDENGCMMSRAPHQRLDTIESRTTSLTTHLNHKEWTPTPYISFTISPAAIQELATFRSQRKNRGVQTLTVIDPNTRLRDHLPILDVAAEMDHYKILDPYGKSNQYYVDHYVCLWQITKREIVGHWQWDDLITNEDWYEQIIMPAFRRFRGEWLPKSRGDTAFDLLTAMNQLSRKSLIKNSITKLMK